MSRYDRVRLDLSVSGELREHLLLQEKAKRIMEILTGRYLGLIGFNELPQDPNNDLTRGAIKLGKWLLTLGYKNEDLPWSVSIVPQGDLVAIVKMVETTGESSNFPYTPADEELSSVLRYTIGYFLGCFERLGKSNNPRETKDIETSILRGVQNFAVSLGIIDFDPFKELKNLGDFIDNLRRIYTRDYERGHYTDSDFGNQNEFEFIEGLVKEQLKSLGETGLIGQIKPQSRRTAIYLIANSLSSGESG